MAEIYSKLNLEVLRCCVEDVLRDPDEPQDVQLQEPQMSGPLDVSKRIRLPHLRLQVDPARESHL